MPILDLQIRMRELGRIRTGEQVAAGRGKRPAKLEHFRLTSASRPLLEAAAELYGGTVAGWTSPAGAQWELKTSVDALPVVIPPGQALSQWMELWTAGGCERRCDGATNFITDEPCACPKDPAERRELAAKGGACKPTTRLNVILPDLPDLGVWRLESHGYYAAVELAGAAQFLAIASARGMNIPARLRLEQREKKVPGKPTNRYAVPVIEFTTTRIADLLAATPAELPVLGEPTGAPQLTSGAVAPAKAPRSRTEKADRPPLGKPPALPDGSNFRRPSPTAAMPVEPPQVASGPVEDDDILFGEPIADADGAIDEDVGLTFEQFKRLRDDEHLPAEVIVAAARELFPGVGGLAALSDQDRGRLYDEAKRRAAQDAA